MLEFYRGFLNITIVFLTILLIAEISVAIPITHKLFRVIRRLKEIVDLSILILSTEFGKAIKSKKNATIAIKKRKYVITNDEDTMTIDGLKIDFQKDLLEQIQPIMTTIENSINENARHLLFKNLMLMKIKDIKKSIEALQFYIDNNEQMA
ncbi:MAG: hypothetical protein J6C46_06015 [Clostridia bacterium]|nr:hypothetical protein [Clostridia bacterium]